MVVEDGQVITQAIVEEGNAIELDFSSSEEEFVEEGIMSETEEEIQEENEAPVVSNNNSAPTVIAPTTAPPAKKTRVHKKYRPETPEEEWFEKWLHQHAPVVSGRQKERRLIWCTFVKAFTFYKHEAASLGT